MLVDRYYFDDGKSRKFWSIASRDKTVVTTSGRLGVKGRESTKVYNFDQLVTPSETVYTVADAAVADRLGLDHGRP